MPIYEYKCRKCGEFEVMRRITDPPLKKCPTCKGKVEPLISRGSFILKGSGWYATDYAKKGASNGGDAASSADSAASNGTSAKSSEKTSDSPAKASEKSGDSKPAAAESKKASSEKPAAAKAAS